MPAKKPRALYRRAAPPFTAAASGGCTRSTWPHFESRSGLSRPFQRAMSRQFWPFSSAMRTSVSPRSTVW